MKENIFKGIITSALAAFVAYFGDLVVPIIILTIVMVMDYVTGMAKAWVKAELSSRTGLLGLLKKVGYLGIVAVAMVIDWLIREGLAELNLTVGFEFFVALLAVIWLIINELISILENLAELGAPKVPLLSSLLEHIKSAVNKKAEAAEKVEEE